MVLRTERGYKGSDRTAQHPHYLAFRRQWVVDVANGQDVRRFFVLFVLFVLLFYLFLKLTQPGELADSLILPNTAEQRT